MSRTPMDDLDAIIVTLSVKRKGTGFEILHYKASEDGPIQNEGELKNIAIRAAELLWETRDIKNV